VEEHGTAKRRAKSKQRPDPAGQGSGGSSSNDSLDQVAGFAQPAQKYEAAPPELQVCRRPLNWPGG